MNGARKAGMLTLWKVVMFSASTSALPSSAPWPMHPPIFYVPLFLLWTLIDMYCPVLALMSLYPPFPQLQLLQLPLLISILGASGQYKDLMLRMMAFALHKQSKLVLQSL